MDNLHVRLIEKLEKLTREDSRRGFSTPGVYCIKFSAPNERREARWKACLALILQGRKEIVLGKEVYKISGGNYVAMPVDLPVLNRIDKATKEAPFLALLIQLDAQTLGHLVQALDETLLESSEHEGQAIFVGNIKEPMLEAALRLTQILEEQRDAKVLAPLAIQEILYHLLRSEHGAAIYQWLCLGSKTNRVQQAITRIHSDLTQEVDVEALAKGARMSRSGFFKEFKDATSFSPIQYLKRLRLLEARRLLVDEGESAEGAAFRVGYRSASQFSREYSRFFGAAPFRDAARAKRSPQLETEF